jgi:nucleotidyltransferase substrate binding protein (TIGR01987 family)
MSDKLRAMIDMLGRAVDRLKEALDRPKDTVTRDSAIQRFEFCCELSWKVLKVFLAEEGVETFFPKEAIREAYRRGIIENDTLWLRTIELRNLSSHTYNESLAEEVYGELGKAFALYQGLLVRLKP